MIPQTLLLCFAASGAIAASPAIWETPAAAADLPGTLKQIEAEAAALPSALTPAVNMQRLLLRIRAGAPMREWRPEMAKFAATNEKDPVSTGLRELALAWEARAQMEDLNKALRKHYAKTVSFPATLDAATLPEPLRKDPWGDAWNYSPRVPAGFSQKFSGQRYVLAPGKRPQVRGTAETIASPAPAKPWKIGAREIAGQKVLEIRAASGTYGAQAGARVDDATILYVGDGWALVGDLERLFTIRF